MSEQQGSNKKKKKQSLLPWVSKNHRLVVVNDLTFVEEKTWRLSPANVALSAASVFFGVAIFTLLLVKFTPLGRLVSNNPRIANKDMRKDLEKLYKELDSLDRELNGNVTYVESLKKLSSETFEYEKDMKKAETVEKPEAAKTFADVPKKTEETKQLLENVQTEQKTGSPVQSVFFESKSSRIDRSVFVTPVRGVVSDSFAPGRSHYGTDIVAPKGSVISATKGGTVIMSTWSADTGHMIGIQHDNNLVSWYKHNSANLKKVGDRIAAGDAIAIIGNSGEMSDGPHLHFELWYNGQPVNAEKYISF